MRSFDFLGYDMAKSDVKIEYIHNSRITSSSAFEIDECGAVRILLPRKLGVVSVCIEIFCEAQDTLILRLPVYWTDLIGSYDAYDANLPFDELGSGLFFYRATVDLFDKSYYIVKRGNSFALCDKPNASLLQLSVSDFAYALPEDKLGGIIYHIFVDRFRRGGKVVPKEGTILVENWKSGIPEYPSYPGAPLENNRFYGGTLYGIIEKLDYISSLGVDTIYLSPIFDASSNHKYDTGDYMSVDEMFGGEEALKLLISAAREHGIGIILDGVFNHTGSDSIYFNRNGRYPTVGAYQSKKSPFYEWYSFSSYPDVYESWWGIGILPKIYPDRPACKEYFLGENGVIAKYAAMGIDGFRLDVVDELSDTFVEGIKEKLNEYNPTSVLYGEVWEDASNKIAYGKRKRYYLGKELDGVMNYPIRRGILEFLTTKNTDALYYALTEIINNAPKRIRNMQMNLLGTHDTERIITLLGGESSAGRSNDYLAKKKMSSLERGKAKRRLKMAYVILATIPGIPAIFYGDEAGLEGYHDPFNRMPYPWGNEDVNLIEFYRMIGYIRRNSYIYKEGEFNLIHLSGDLLIFERYNNSESFITVVNNSTADLRIIFEKTIESLLDKINGVKEIRLNAFSAGIYKVERQSEFYVTY